MKKVLFVCTHNSARSQMAEGLLRSMYGDRYEAYSAGTQPTRVNPFAVKAMAQIGIDISLYSTKSIEKYKTTNFDYVVTLCDEAREECPVFPNARKALHKSFPDSSLIKGTEAENLNKVAEIRDQIKSFIEKQFGEIIKH